MRFKDTVHVNPSLPPGKPRLLPEGPFGESNVRIRLIDPSTGRVVEERNGHNIFVNYGRDWIAHLVGYDVGHTTFRDDRLRYMAFGIGGTRQRVPSATIRAAHAEWAGFADDWAIPPPGVGTADAVQTDEDPTVTALEWPVECIAGSYYDPISTPATFPTTGVIRFTSVLGINEVSFGAFASVPISEIGLFTSGIVGALGTPPVVHGALPSEKFMVAYHTFDELSKTAAFVMQADWELRFS